MPTLNLKAQPAKTKEERVEEREKKKRAIAKAVRGWLRQNPGLEEKELAARISSRIGRSYSPQALYNAKTEGYMGIKPVFALAAETGLDPEALNDGRIVTITSRASSNEKQESTHSPAGTGIRHKIPIIGDSERGPDMEQVTTESVTHYVDSAVNDEQGYAIRIHGTEFHPRYKDGEAVKVTPQILPQPSDEVAVRWSTGEFGLYELVYWLGEDIGLAPIPSEKGPRISCSMSELTFMQRIEGGAPASSIRRYNNNS